MPIGLDKTRVETILKEVAAQPVAPVEPLCVDAVQLPHPIGERAPLGVDQQMEVVRHQTVRRAPPALVRDNAPEELEKTHSIAVVHEDQLLSISARRDVVDAVSEL